MRASGERDWQRQQQQWRRWWRWRQLPLLQSSAGFCLICCSLLHCMPHSLSVCERHAHVTARTRSTPVMLSLSLCLLLDLRSHAKLTAVQPASLCTSPSASFRSILSPSSVSGLSFSCSFPSPLGVSSQSGSLGPTCEWNGLTADAQQNGSRATVRAMCVCERVSGQQRENQKTLLWLLRQRKQEKCEVSCFRIEIVSLRCYICLTCDPCLPLLLLQPPPPSTCVLFQYFPLQPLKVESGCQSG